MRGTRPVWLALLCLCWSSGCNHRPTPGLHPRYTVGPPWESDGFWFYPSERTSYEATGLAVVDAPEAISGRETADGERYNPSRLAGSHQTLQLPAILRVRNLENGREILLRINDRGPASSARLLSVSPDAASLLHMDPDAATRVALSLDQKRSEDLLVGLDGAPASDIEAAPVGVVQEESLMPPPGSRAADRRTLGSIVRATQAPGPVSLIARGTDLPETVTLTRPDPGRLWIDAGQFSVPSYASTLAARLGGRVRQRGHGRTSVFQVWVGPFDQVSDADAALDRVRSAGVTGALIVVE